MTTPTYDLIESVTLTASASSVTFSTIPQDYRDLVLVFEGKSAQGGGVQVRFNSDSGGNYNLVRMAGNGSTANSFAQSNQNFLKICSQINIFSATANTLITATVMDYSATDKHKSVLSRANKSDDAVEAIAGRYASTTAITSFELFLPNAGSYDAGSTFNLYGIAA